jgi:hypothetical protein
MLAITIKLGTKAAEFGLEVQKTSIGETIMLSMTNCCIIRPQHKKFNIKTSVSQIQILSFKLNTIKSILCKLRILKTYPESAKL